MKTQKRQNYKCNKKISVCQEVGGAQCGGGEMNRQSIRISGQYNVFFFGSYNGGKRYIRHLSKPIEGRTPRVNLNVSNGACRLLSFNTRTTLVWNVNDGGGCTCWGKAQRVHENCIFCSVLLWTYMALKKQLLKITSAYPSIFLHSIYNMGDIQNTNTWLILVFAWLPLPEASYAKARFLSSFVHWNIPRV